MRSTIEASLAWKILNGIVCLYKPPTMSTKTVKYTIRQHLCDDLNKMKVRPPTPHVVIGSGEKSVAQVEDAHAAVKVIPSYADNVLVVGPRYIPEEIKCLQPFTLSHRTSGVLLLGLNKGVRLVKNMNFHQLVRVYQVGVRLGYETESGWFDTGMGTVRAKFLHVPSDAITKVLSAMQASHQRRAFEYAGVLPDSQEAYELAKEGIVKPKSRQGAVIYGARILDFKLPNFTIELHTLNEDEEFFLTLVTELGRRIRSAATVTAIKCVQVGNFSTEHALSSPQWNLNNILSNLRLCHRLTRENPELKRITETHDSENSTEKIYDLKVQ